MELVDCLRAVSRGLGPPRQAEPFDLAAVGNLYEVDEAFFRKRGYPEQVRDTVILGSWWMLREVELAAAALAQLSFSDDPQAKEGQRCGIATLLLPVSKADCMALGKVRSLRCSCPSVLCPVGAARRLFESAKARQAATGLSEAEVQLIVDTEGAPVSKVNIIKAFKDLAIA